MAGMFFDLDSATCFFDGCIEDIRGLPRDFDEVYLLKRFGSRSYPGEVEQVTQELPHTARRINDPVEVIFAGTVQSRGASF